VRIDSDRDRHNSIVIIIYIYIEMNGKNMRSSGSSGLLVRATRNLKPEFSFSAVEKLPGPENKGKDRKFTSTKGGRNKNLIFALPVSLNEKKKKPSHTAHSILTDFPQWNCAS